MAGNVYSSALGIHVIDSTGSVITSESTVMIDLVTWVGNTVSHDLKLEDDQGNVFVETKGAVATPVVLPFPKPRKLKGLKVATIDSGKCLVYVAKS